MARQVLHRVLKFSTGCFPDLMVWKQPDSDEQQLVWHCGMCASFAPAHMQHQLHGPEIEQLWFDASTRTMQFKSKLDSQDKKYELEPQDSWPCHMVYNNLEVELYDVLERVQRDSKAMCPPISTPC